METAKRKFPLLQTTGNNMKTIPISHVINALKQNSITGLISITGHSPDQIKSLGNSETPTFYDSSKNILDLIEANQHDSSIFFLKSLSNFFIGSLAYNPNNYQKTVLMKKNHFISTKLKNFRGSKPLTNDHCYGFFSQKRHYANCVHNNFFIVQMARLRCTVLHSVSN